MRITVTSNIDQVFAKLDAAARKQVAFAVAMGLTKTAQAVKAAQEREIVDVFDRPTEYTKRSVYMKPATRNELVATVGIKDMASGVPPSKFLAPEVFGGERRLKRFERALRASGVLPTGYFVVPGAAADIDAYGNWSVGQIRQILSWFKAAEMTAGYSANMTQKRRDKLRKGSKTKQGFAYFVGRPGDGRMPFGIWRRVYFAQGTAIKPVALFVTFAQYESRWDFEYVGRKTVEREVASKMKDAFAVAMATARS